MELSLNQTLAPNLLLEVAYAGSKGTKLAERVNINQARLPDPTNITPDRAAAAVFRLRRYSVRKLAGEL